MGASLRSLFKANYSLTKTNENISIEVSGSAVFSNLLGYKKVLTNLEPNKIVSIDFSKTKIVDHSFMAFIHHLEHEYNANGGQFTISGLSHHKALSKHPLATRVKKK